MGGSEDEEEEDGKVDKEKESKVAVKGMAVEVGKEEAKEDDNIEDEEYRLRVMMIKNKHRGLYKSMMKGRKRRENEAKIMEKKRKAHDEEEVAKKKAKKVAKMA